MLSKSRTSTLSGRAVRMTHLKDFACINCRDHAVRVVLALERHLYLQCDGCGEQSAISERRASVRDPTVSAEHPRTALEAAVFCQGRGPPFGDAPPQVAAAAHEPDLPVHDREALNCRRFARRATLYVVRSGRIKFGHR